MLTKVEVRTVQGDLLSLELEDVSSGLVVQDIKGLDPVKASLVSSNFAQLDGAQFHSARREPRNIIITLGLEPDYVTTSVLDLRNQLYKWFMPKSEINLRFYMSEGLTVTIDGHIETFESELFTKDPSVDISIMCFQPDLLDLETTEIDGNTVSDTTETEVVYDGTVDSGIVFTLNVDRVLSDFTIYHRPPNGTLLQLDFSASLVAGDVVTIKTINGQKSAMLNRGGTLSSVLYAVLPQSSWIQLGQGDNTLRIYATGAAIPYTVQYMNRYGGL